MKNLAPRADLAQSSESAVNPAEVPLTGAFDAQRTFRAPPSPAAKDFLRSDACLDKPSSQVARPWGFHCLPDPNPVGRNTKPDPNCKEWTPVGICKEWRAGDAQDFSRSVARIAPPARQSSAKDFSRPVVRLDPPRQSHHEQVICVEMHLYNGSIFSAPALERHIADAYAAMRDRWPQQRQPSPYDGGHGVLSERGKAWRYDRPERVSRAWMIDVEDADPALRLSMTEPVLGAVRTTWPSFSNPLSTADLAEDFTGPAIGHADASGDLDDDATGLLSDCGYQVSMMFDGERRSKVNRDAEYRLRAGAREKSRHDPADFVTLVDDAVARGLTLNATELDLEALDLVTTPESDPALEFQRHGVLAALKADRHLPRNGYLKMQATRLRADGYRPTPPRLPAIRPGLAIGEDQVCAEFGLALHELDGAIASGQFPITRRSGVVIGLKGTEGGRPKARTKGAVAKTRASQLPRQTSAGQDDQPSL